MERIQRRRRLYCNRTLNLRSIRAVGYDMDYTLIHYDIEAWERRVYGYVRDSLVERGLPVSDLKFDPTLAARGLIVDIQKGNLIKANRFGFVKNAFHGLRAMPFAERRDVYARTFVDLREPRWRFLNTFFSLSEACMFMQLVQRYDEGRLEVAGYRALYYLVREAMDEAHVEGRLKAEIAADPETFLDLDPEVPLALLDQKNAGKKVLLITNSEPSYAIPMLHRAFDRFLPDGMTWRELFDCSMFSARKPSFFTHSMPAFALMNDDGMLKAHNGPLQEGQLYLGGDARLVEDSFDLAGEEILYVGDHIFADINVSKSLLRWRTALIVRELEDEVDALEAFCERESNLEAMMGAKESAEQDLAEHRLRLQRLLVGYGPAVPEGQASIEADIAELKLRIEQLDIQIAPLAAAASQRLDPRWGLSMRVGRDKSHLARQIERYADVYTSRVSNFLYATPFAYLRAGKGSLPHDE